MNTVTRIELNNMSMLRWMSGGTRTHVQKRTHPCDKQGDASFEKVSQRDD